jgi:hypothetical protein
VKKLKLHAMKNTSVAFAAIFVGLMLLTGCNKKQAENQNSSGTEAKTPYNIAVIPKGTDRVHFSVPVHELVLGHG